MRLFLSLLSFFALVSCQSAVSPQSSSDSAAQVDKSRRFSLANEGINGKLLSPGDWLGQDLDFAPYNQLREQLEKDLGRPLKNRGEAHITVITPPEMKVLKRKITDTDILNLAKMVDLAKSKFDIVCLGRGQKEGLETYFVVVKSRQLESFRKGIARIAGNPPEFKPEEFYPHITLGFTDRDLHLQDGVVKNEKSCRNSIDR